jgi:hypothetical protein
MQLVSCQSSSRINRTHQNDMLTIVTGIADVIMLVAIVVWAYAFIGLVPPHSPKLGLIYLKNEAH